MRRLNHNFLAQGRGMEAARDIVGIVYFFAKYANHAPLEWESRLGAWLQGRRIAKRRRAENLEARQKFVTAAPTSDSA